MTKTRWTNELYILLQHCPSYTTKSPTHGQLAQAWKTYGGEQESEPQTFAKWIMKARFTWCNAIICVLSDIIQFIVISHFLFPSVFPFSQMNAFCFLQAKSDTIEALEKYRGSCEPCFLFFAVSGTCFIHV